MYMQSVFKHRFFHAAVFGSIALVVLFMLFFGEELSRGVQVKNAAPQQTEHVQKTAAENIYGGGTPEETFVLFLKALSAGDVDLASTYFVADKQGNWKNILLRFKEEGVLASFAKDVSSATLTAKNKDSASFTITTLTGTGEALPVATMVLTKNADGQWRISGL